MENGRDTDDLGYVKLPRKLRLPVLAALVLFVLGAPAWATRLELRLAAMEAERQQEDGVLERMERTLCRMCIHELDADSCSEICHFPRMGDRKPTP